MHQSCHKYMTWGGFIFSQRMVLVSSAPHHHLCLNFCQKLRRALGMQGGGPLLPSGMLKVLSSHSRANCEICPAAFCPTRAGFSQLGTHLAVPAWGWLQDSSDCDSFLFLFLR